MPVGTKASVKAVLPGELRDLGAQIVLGNAYHLYFRPGADRIDRLGGLHRFMGWDGADPHRLGRLPGVLAARHGHDRGRGRRLPVGLRRLAAPVHARAGDGDPAPPRLRHRDGLRRVPAGRASSAAKLEDAVRRTSLWAERCRACEPAPGQLVFGICQGGVDLALRERSAEHIVSLGFDGHAIGGLTGGGEPRGDVRHDPRRPPQMLPARAAALLHGDRRSRGRDRGHRRRASTCSTACFPPGSAAPARRSSPAAGSTCETPPTPTTSARCEEGCTCPACTTFSRAYIRHLITQDEIVGLRLLTLHNLHVLFELVRGAREAIRAGTFSKYRSTRLSAP